MCLYGQVVVQLGLKKEDNIMVLSHNCAKMLSSVQDGSLVEIHLGLDEKGYIAKDIKNIS